MEFVTCPELVAPDDQRCNQLAEVTLRCVMESTSGPVEMIRTRCLGRHVLFFPAFMLEQADPRAGDEAA